MDRHGIISTCHLVKGVKLVVRTLFLLQVWLSFVLGVVQPNLIYLTIGRVKKELNKRVKTTIDGTMGSALL